MTMKDTDTPDTDEAYNPEKGWTGVVPVEHARKLERERNMWKANHDNQAELKRIIATRPDLAERAPLVEKLHRERNELLAAVIKLRDCKGRFHSEQAAKELFELANFLEKKSCGESSNG